MQAVFVLKLEKMKNALLKSSVLFALLTSFSFAMNAQETEVDSTRADSTEKEKNDWKISIGKTNIIIQKNRESDTLELSGEGREQGEKKKNQRYNHFAGIDVGINGFVSPNQSIDLQDEANFLELNYRKSFEISFNLWEKYLPIWEEKLGLVTGAGFKFNNYDLVQDVIVVNRLGSTFGEVDSNRSINKNRLKTTSIHVPLMLETNLGKDAKHSFHLAAGGMVTYILNTRTKQKYKEGGENFKKKVKSDFNVNDFQFAATARVGYGDVTLYATYNLTPLFENNKGPEVIPFTIGLSLMTF
jgi:hypothetical protein